MPFIYFSRYVKGLSVIVRLLSASRHFLTSPIGRCAFRAARWSSHTIYSHTTALLFSAARSADVFFLALPDAMVTMEDVAISMKRWNHFVGGACRGRDRRHGHSVARSPRNHGWRLQNVRYLPWGKGTVPTSLGDDGSSSSPSGYKT